MGARFKLLTTEEASEYLDGAVPVQTLHNWRWTGRGPEFVKLPNGKVRYRSDVLDKFIESHTVAPINVTP